MMRHQSLWDRIWKDSKGNVVIIQKPNIFLIGWIVLTIASLFIFSRGTLADALAIAGCISLIIWALHEMWRGVNYFRRVLGLFVLIFAVMVLLKNI